MHAVIVLQLVENVGMSTELRRCFAHVVNLNGTREGYQSFTFLLSLLYSLTLTANMQYCRSTLGRHLHQLHVDGRYLEIVRINWNFAPNNHLMERPPSFGAGADSIGLEGDESRTSWAAVDPHGEFLASGQRERAHVTSASESESLHSELESLDPLKRELLEARIMRKVCPY